MQHHLIPGPFGLSLDRASAIDFTRPVLEGHDTVVVPLKHKANMWFMIYPFTYPVWLLVIISIPIYMLAMWLADYTYCRSADWDQLCGFVLRNALSEQNSRPPNHAKAFQKILIITWLLSVLVLVQSYAGNLTAMLAKPSLESPIKTLDELLSQNEVSWVIEVGTAAEYATSTAAPVTKMKRLFERAKVMSPISPQERMMHGGCFKTKMMQGRIVELIVAKVKTGG